MTVVLSADIRSEHAPFLHQVEGINAIVNWDDPFSGRIFGGCFALFDEMGSGKTYQVINAAQILFERNLVDRVFVVAPAPIRSVWFDPELGELKKHLWPDIPAWITEYHARRRQWKQGLPRTDGRALKWIITNYDYIRDQARLATLMNLGSKRAMLVLDESSAIKNPSAKQTKSCFQLRGHCGRVVLLNGTPTNNSPGDLFSQARMMDPKIYGIKSLHQFCARYAVMGGWQGRKALSWHGIEEIQQKLKPYVLRRLKEQCIDLPEKLETVPMPATLTSKTWNYYKQMRDDMVTWLSEDTLVTAQQAIVRILRLSQITSGFLSGVQQGDVDYSEGTDESEGKETPLKVGMTEEIGTEKLELFLQLLDVLLNQDPNLKLLIWCRFRHELLRLSYALQNKKYVNQPSFGLIWGGQKREDRDHALRLLDPRTAPVGPAFVCGTPATGAMGLNLTAAHTVVYMSNDYNHKTRIQSEDRVHRPGQVHHVSYFDIVAEGPQGQRTIDHIIFQALQNKEDLAKRTASAWIRDLQKEFVA